MSFSYQVGQEGDAGRETLTDPPLVIITRFPAIHVRFHREGLRHFLGPLLSCCRVGSCGEDGTGVRGGRAMLTVGFGIRVSLASLQERARGIT